MKKKTIWITSAAAATVLVVGGVGIAVADPFDGDGDVTGSAFDRASEAAIAEAGGGTVESVESSDDVDHAYEVDVRLENGRDVDVELDDDFTVVRSDADGRGDAASGNDEGRDDSTDRDAGSDESGPDADGSDSDRDRADDGTLPPLTDADRAAASDAALAEVGEGTVTDVDRSDDADHAYEVDLDLADGSDVDVELDEAFAVTRVDR